MTDLELEQLLTRRAPELRSLWLSALPDMSDLPEYDTSLRFRRRMDKLLRRQRHSAILRQVRQAMIAAVLLIVFTFSGLMVTSEAFRNDVISVVIKAFQTITEFHYSAGFSTDQTPSDIAVTYLPHGMEESHRVSDDPLCEIYFEDNSGHFVMVRQVVVGSSTAYSQGLNTEDADIWYLDIHGSAGTCIYKKGTCTITWTRQNIAYTVISTHSVEETQKIALGIR